MTDSSDLHPSKAGGLIKLLFRLERDARGWPPVDIEGLWSSQTSSDAYVLYNTPFYAREVALGDVVSATRQGDELFFDKVLKEGGHGTIRVLLKRAAEMESVCARLESFCCELETAEPRLIAIDVRPDTAVDALLAYLDEEERASRFGYEVACQSW
jgi:hypothetical protein